MTRSPRDSPLRIARADEGDTVLTALPPEHLEDLSPGERAWIIKHLLASPPTPLHVRQSVANDLATLGLLDSRPTASARPRAA